METDTQFINSDNPSSNKIKLPKIPEKETLSQQQKSLSQPRQFISSNNFEPKSSLKQKIVNPCGVEEIDNIVCYFCGGRNCKKEQAQFNKFPNAIDGLHSNWITDNILAMQRPNNGIIQQHNLIQAFKNNYIGVIINLQERGEHAKCGPDLVPGVGFTYNPELFSNSGISCYNYGWEDMTADTTFENLIKICSGFDLALSQGKKTAVHCHAGTGRTGVGICSWLIYKEGMSAEQAIKLFQAKRADSLGKSTQQQLLKDFEKYLNQSRKWFDYPLMGGFSLDLIIKQQNKLEIGKLKNRTKHIPAPVYVILNKYQLLLSSSVTNVEQIQNSFVELQKYSPIPLKQKQITDLKQRFNSHNYEIGHVSDLRILSQVLLSLLEDSPIQIISDTFISQIKKDQSPIEIIINSVKILQVSGFEMLNVLVKFCKLLNQYDKNVELKNLIIRFSIAFLKKKHIMDEYFHGDSLIRVSEIHIPQVVHLYKFIETWIQTDNQVISDIVNICLKFVINKLELEYRKLQS